MGTVAPPTGDDDDADDDEASDNNSQTCQEVGEALRSADLVVEAVISLSAGSDSLGLEHVSCTGLQQLIENAVDGTGIDADDAAAWMSLDGSGDATQGTSRRMQSTAVLVYMQFPV